jgi:cobalt-zinc-cadmium efflux system membrane fusion protein
MIMKKNILILLASLGCLASCRQQSNEVAEGRFRLTDTMLTRISIDTIADRPVLSELKLSAKITPQDKKMTSVFAVVGGLVTKVHVTLGDYVEKGATLASIRSTEIADFERQLRDAQSDLMLAEKNKKVAEDLFTSKLNSERDVASAEKEVENARAELARIQEVMRIYRVNGSSVYNVVAPISGYVIEKKLNENMQLPSGYNENIFTIAQLDEVFVTANVYENDIQRIRIGMPVEVEMLSYPGKRMKGTVDKILSILDPVSKTLKVNIRMMNPGLLLKPDMIATVYVAFDEGGRMTAVPDEAVVFDNSRNYLMMYIARDSIVTREIQPYRSAGGYTYIQSGISPGERVIARNALMIYDAIND